MLLKTDTSWRKGSKFPFLYKFYTKDFYLTLKIIQQNSGSQSGIGSVGSAHNNIRWNGPILFLRWLEQLQNQLLVPLNNCMDSTLKTSFY